MAYEGYLIRLLSATGATHYDIRPQDIKINTYQVTWEGQDYSSYRDDTGYLHRVALKSRPPKVEFYTRNGMTGAELNTFMSGVRNLIRNKEERKYYAKIFIPEINDYITDEVYMPEPTFSIHRIEGSTLYYNSFRMAFIGYGTSGSWSNS